MTSISNLPSQVYFDLIMQSSGQLLLVFLILGGPAFVVVWLLRRKAMWLRVMAGVLSVVAMSIVMPVSLFLFHSESSTATNYLPAN